MWFSIKQKNITLCFIFCWFSLRFQEIRMQKILRFAAASFFAQETKGVFRFAEQLNHVPAKCHMTLTAS